MRSIKLSSITLLVPALLAACSAEVQADDASTAFDASEAVQNPFCAPGLSIEKFSKPRPLRELIAGWTDGTNEDEGPRSEFGKVFAATELRMDARTGIGLIRGTTEKEKSFQLGVIRRANGTLSTLSVDDSGMTLFPGEYDIDGELLRSGFKHPSAELVVFGSVVASCPESKLQTAACPATSAKETLYLGNVDSDGRAFTAANLRTGPSAEKLPNSAANELENNIIGTMVSGTPVRVLETVTAGTRIWAKVEVGPGLVSPPANAQDTFHGAGLKIDYANGKFENLIGYVRADFLSAVLPGYQNGAAESTYCGVAVTNGVASAESIMDVKDEFGWLSFSQCDSAKTADGRDVRFFELSSTYNCDDTGECEADTIHVTDLSESGFTRPLLGE